MIKDLISDLAFEKIKLSQALTRAKIIAHKVNNDSFKAWLAKELEGYIINDEFFPKYRRINCPIIITAEFPYGQVINSKVILPDILEDKLGEYIYYHDFYEPIAIIEEHIESIENSVGYFSIPQNQLSLLSTLYKKNMEGHNGVIKEGRREIGKSQLKIIVELTKQKLFDTLMSLDAEFPNLINEFEINALNKDKVQSIVTNNIYGNSGSMTIASGQNVNQHYIEHKNINYEILKSFGVGEHDIKELKTIVKDNSENKESLKKKVFKWLGSVSASMAARGLYDKIPEITEFVETLI